MGDAKHFYQVRDRNGHIDVDLSEARILSRIERGKYTGEEEVSVPPYVEWRKISAIPAFYDALMKRLFEGGYQSPDKDPEKTVAPPPEKSSADEHATRRANRGGDPAKTLHVEEDHKTRHTVPREGTIGEGTIDQALIRELFEEDGSAAEAIDDESPVEEREVSLGAELPEAVAVDEPPPASLDTPLDAPLDFAAGPTEEEAGAAALAAAQSKKAPNRRLLLWIVLLGGLSLLLLDSGEQGSLPIAERTRDTAPQATVITDPGRLKQKVEGLIWEGNQIHRQDNGAYYLQAAQVFAEAIAFDAKSSAAYGGQAEALAMWLLGRPEETNGARVIEIVKKGRLLDPQLSAFYRAEALVALRRQQFEEARLAIRRAIDTDPTSPQNALVLGEISYAFKDLDTARASLKEAAGSRVTANRANYYLAKIALDLDDTVLARKYLRETLSQSPLHQKSHLLLGDVAAKENKMEEALNHYRSAARLALLAERDSAAEAYFRLGRLYEILNQEIDSKECYLLALAFKPKISPDIGQKLGGMDRSEENVSVLLQKYTLNRDQFAARAETYRRQGNPERAFLYYQAAHVLDPQNGEILLKMGELVEENAVYYEDFLRVIGFYERAIDRDTTLAQAYIRLGLLETEQYNLDRGAALLMQAKALAPNDRDTRVALGKHYYKKQDYNRALDEFLAASKLKENDSEVLFYAGKMRLLFTRDQSQAMTFFEQAYKSDPFNYEALIEWLRLKVASFDKNFAIKLVKNLIEKDPSNSKYYWALGEVYAANRDFRKAISLYQRSLDLDNKDAKVRLALARALEADTQVDKAILEYRLASRLDRRNLEGFYRASELLIEQRKYDEAEEVLKVLIETSPKYPGAHRFLSRVYRAQKKKEEALAELEKEVGFNPQNTEFRLELAETLMGYQDFERAVEQLTEISNLPEVSKAPEFLYDKKRAYLLLSRCYRQLGRFESAEGAIRLALELDSRDPLLHRELGYVYVALQRNTEAASAFEDYLKRSPAAQDAATIKQLINRLVIPE